MRLEAAGPAAGRRRPKRPRAPPSPAAPERSASPEVRRQIRWLATDAETTIQALLGEAFNDLFAKHGLAEIADADS